MALFGDTVERARKKPTPDAKEPRREQPDSPESVAKKESALRQRFVVTTQNEWLVASGQLLVANAR